MGFLKIFLCIAALLCGSFSRASSHYDSSDQSHAHPEQYGPEGAIAIEEELHVILDNTLPQLTEAVSILIEQAVERATQNMVPAEQVDQMIAEATQNMVPAEQVDQMIAETVQNMVPAEQVDLRIAEATENMIRVDDWPGGGCSKWISIEEANDRPWRTKSQDHALRRIGGDHHGLADGGQIERYGDWRWGTVEERNQQALEMLNRYINAENFYRFARSGPWISGLSVASNICDSCSEEDYERAETARGDAIKALQDFLTEDFAKN